MIEEHDRYEVVVFFSHAFSHYGLTICPRHRAEFGIHWRTRKTPCAVPKELAAHKSVSARGSHCVDTQHTCSGWITYVSIFMLVKFFF